MSEQLGAPLATGRTSDIYSWGPEKVIKVFTDTLDANAIATEIDNSRQAHALDITPIRCYGGHTLDDGRPGIIFDRIRGDALTTIAERRPYRIPAVARTLAREQVAVHAVHSESFPDVRDVAVSLLDTAPLAALTEAERSDIRRRIVSLPGGNSVLHLDFHPMNVFEHDAGLATIDWQSTAIGDPAADVAATTLLFTEAELFPGLSAMQRVVYQSVRRVMLRFYRSEYQRLTGIDSAAVAPWMITARVLRLGWLDVEGERDALLGRIRSELRGTNR